MYVSLSILCQFKRVNGMQISPHGGKATNNYQDFSEVKHPPPSGNTMTNHTQISFIRLINNYLSCVFILSLYLSCPLCLRWRLCSLHRNNVFVWRARLFFLTHIAYTIPCAIWRQLTMLLTGTTEIHFFVVVVGFASFMQQLVT